MRAVILGGSFNPLHLGHLFLAEQVMLQEGYDSLFLIPSHRPAHKSNEGMAPAALRLEMVRKACCGHNGWVAEDCEIRRGGTSYTIDTLDYLEERYPIEGKIGVILGDDLISGFHRWKKAEELSQRAQLILALREGEGADQKSALFPYPHRVVKNRPLPLSSTEIRNRIPLQEAWQTLVPSSTAAIIKREGLYGFSGEGKKPSVPISRGCVQEELVHIMTQKRFAHSLRTAQEAVRLCRQHGVPLTPEGKPDEDKAFLAGLLHDSARDFSLKRQREWAQELPSGVLQSMWGGVDLESLDQALLHGPAAAVMIQRKWGILEKDIQEAVLRHTLGGPQMGPLAQIVYIADYCEPGRPFMDTVKAAYLETLSLPKKVAMVHKASLQHLRNKGKKPMLASKRLKRELKEQGWWPTEGEMQSFLGGGKT